ncbi:MAG TPA: ATP-binding protein [Aestuariivirga sp.]|nr:ATP-binding protein [Aestuariivirga sp.]
MSEVIEAKPEPDFWLRMCKTGPERAIAELIWNSMDADADKVDVEIKINGLDGIDQISISDNGTGIVPNPLGHDFSHLGGSWKAQSHKTRNQKRILHGKNGQGRFRAFSLGANVVWETAYSSNNSTFRYSISGSTQNPGKFTIGDLQELSSSSTGTTVTIHNVDEAAHRLRLANAHDDLSRVFAPYLNQYKGINLSIAGRPIDSTDLILRSAEFANDDDHLIIELKRASKVLGLKDLNQLEEYANSVMRNPRFEKTAVRWSFWLVGVELAPDLEERANSGDREPGCTHVFKNGRGKIWVKTWGQILQDSLDRLEFVREKLNFAITEQDAIGVLERVYPEFVPSAE